MPDGGPDHEEFLRRLRASHPYVLAVVERLKRNGIHAWAKQPEEAKTPKEKARFANEHDVHTVGGHILEVKSRNLRFTEEPSSFPFADGANLCSVARWQRRTEKPLAFVLVSTFTDAMLVCSAATETLWTQYNQPDFGRHGHTDMVYRIDRQHLRPFDALVAYLWQIIDPALLTRPDDTPRPDVHDLEEPHPYCKPHSSHFCPCCKPHLFDENDPKDAAYIRGWEEIAPIVPLIGDPR